MADQTESLPGDPRCVVTHRFAVINGVRLHYVAAEPSAERVRGRVPLCIALHGFPEFWYSWRRQIPALTAAGFRVLALDQRGYNLSDKPAAVSSYRIDELSADVAGLIAHVGEQKAHVIGHDWGGVVAWAVALRYPDAVEKLVVLNAPHPAAYVRELRTWQQRLRSWYVLFFQLPGLPELLIRAGNYALLERGFLREPIHADAFSAADVLLYKEALSQPGALTAALNYYRAAFRYRRALQRQFDRLTVPTLLLWGERDRYLGLPLTEGLERWVANLRLERIADASHWVQNDAPLHVNAAILKFLAGSETPAD
jgi:epoxide hydrolase 4